MSNELGKVRESKYVIDKDLSVKEVYLGKQEKNKIIHFKENPNIVVEESS